MVLAGLEEVLQELALTRVGTIGPLAKLLETSGGSVARVFRRAELPLELLQQPYRLILLRDQFQLAEAAAREIGDDAFPARLSIAAGLNGLGPYGHHLMSFKSLGTAISTAYQAFGRLLQASTQMELTVSDGWARWTYHVTAPLAAGRQKNELLALGYMLVILRQFTGPRWTPDRVELPGTLRRGNVIESVIGSELAPGHRAAVVFPADLLDHPNPGAPRKDAVVAAPIPAVTETAPIVRHMIGLNRLMGTSAIEGVAARLGVTRRTLQRRLAREGVTFAELSQAMLRAEAAELLQQRNVPIADIAYQLGYSDPAHFTRAFRRWTNEAPNRWRRTITGLDPKAAEPGAL